MRALPYADSRLVTAFVLLACMLCARMLEAQSRTNDLLISDVRVFDPDSGTFSMPQDVLVRDGRIAQVGTVDREGLGIPGIDAAGAFAVPGLWDSHVHLSPLTLTGGDTLIATLGAMARRGILYVRDAGGPLDVLAELAARTKSGAVQGPAIFYGGPLAERPPLYWDRFNVTLPGFTVPVESENDVRKLVAALADSGGFFVKAFGKWDVDLFRRLHEHAAANGLGVVVDPGAPFFQSLPVDTLLSVGVTSIEHGHAPWQTVLKAELRARHDSLMTAGVEPALRPAFILDVASRGAESLDRQLLRRLTESWKQSGTFFCPTLRVIEARRRSMPPFPSAETEGDRSRLWNGWADASAAMTVAVAAAGVPLLVGQDDYSPDATLEEMEMLVSIGISPVDVLRAATIHAARALRREGELGSLEVGRAADMLLVRENPVESIANLREPWLVIQRGEIIHRAP